jgi:hypothetical protein
MENDRPGKPKVRSLTVAALLGIFVVAVVLAIAGRAVPGGLSRMIAEARGKVRGRADEGAPRD